MNVSELAPAGIAVGQGTRTATICLRYWATLAAIVFAGNAPYAMAQARKSAPCVTEPDTDRAEQHCLLPKRIQADD